ncbi:UNKNOWN [Stylonychia lemnae]|uniref:Transmembrane protein n=1 Tax=Stylonychia lemnae TaxID=5949 RepID=A0A078A0D3_STYLE|nr:UNKNOWN [Stylonychia lemnae]|eukprot:CDW74243.1 UNKNOWN [Stylonychia lemnae]
MKLNLIRRAFSASATASSQGSTNQIQRQFSKMLTYNVQSKDYLLVDVNNIEELLAQKKVYLIRDFPQYRKKSENPLTVDDQVYFQGDLIEYNNKANQQQYGTQVFNNIYNIKTEFQLDELVGVLQTDNPLMSNMQTPIVHQAKIFMTEFETRDQLKVLFMTQEQISEVFNNGLAREVLSIKSLQDENFHQKYFKNEPQNGKIFAKIGFNLMIFATISVVNLYIFKNMFNLEQKTQDGYGLISQKIANKLSSK